MSRGGGELGRSACNEGGDCVEADSVILVFVALRLGKSLGAESNQQLRKVRSSGKSGRVYKQQLLKTDLHSVATLAAYRAWLFSSQFTRRKPSRRRLQRSVKQLASNADIFRAPSRNVKRKCVSYERLHGRQSYSRTSVVRSLNEQNQMVVL